MTGSSHILFNAGGLLLAADSASVHCIHGDLITQKEASTHPWFLGVAVADERLLPVTDLGAFLGAEPSQGRVIAVARNLGIAGLKVDDVHGVSRIDSEYEDSAQQANERDWPVQARRISDLGQHYQILDIAKLLQSSRFLNVEHMPA